MMKKKIYIMSLIAMTTILLSLVSCTQKIDQDRPDIKDYEIRFESPIIKTSKEAKTMTKSVIEGDVYPSTLSFKVFAVKHSGDFSTWSGSDTYFGANGSEVSYIAAKNGWGSNPNHFWPKNSNSKLSFSAFSPADASPATVDGNGVRFQNYTVNLNANAQVDLLYSDRVVNKKFSDMKANENAPNYFGIQIPFYHSLAQIIFRTKLGEELPNVSTPADPENDDFIRIKEISLKKVYTTADFSQYLHDYEEGVGNAAWNNHSHLDDYKNVLKSESFDLTYSSDPDYKGDITNTYPILVLPQTFQTQSYVYIQYDEKYNGELRENKEISVKLTDINFGAENGKEFKMGKRYIIDILYISKKIRFLPHTGEWVGIEGLSSSIKL